MIKIIGVLCVLLLIEGAKGRSCEQVASELNTDSGNPWRYTNTKPRCRIAIGTESSPLDLDRLHVKNLTECIQNCYSDVNCQAVTFKYTKVDKASDNCWLKIATTATRRVDEPASNVTVVSVFKPSSVAFNATNRTCEEVKKHLSESTDKDWREQEPLCRVDFRGNADLTRYHVPDLAACIDYCKKVPSCKGLTFGYGAPNPGFDNCWLKGSINTTVLTPENSTQVIIVSLTKPVKEKTCFDDSKCKTSFILSVIGTALGLIATLGSIVGVLVHSKDETFPNVFDRSASAVSKTSQLTTALMTIRSQKKTTQFQGVA